MEALAVFHGTGHFDHCFVCVRDKGAWIKLEGIWGRTFLEYLGEDPSARYAARGLKVVRAAVRPGANLYPAMGATCVGMAKRVLGIRKPFLWTTKQLRLFLER